MTAQIHDATFHLVNKNRALTLTNRMFLIAGASLEIAGLGQLLTNLKSTKIELNEKTLEALHYFTYRYMKFQNTKTLKKNLLQL